jgi:hypothetical protein
MDLAALQHAVDHSQLARRIVGQGHLAVGRSMMSVIVEARFGGADHLGRPRAMPGLEPVSHRVSPEDDGVGTLAAAPILMPSTTASPQIAIHPQ